MTTTVTVSAHLADTKEVVISIGDESGIEGYSLQDGESRDFHVYDGRTITVKEKIKAIVDEEVA